MHAASGGHTSFQNIQKSKLFENLNDAYMYIDAYVCNLEIKLRWNELLCSQDIVNRHFERKECFSAASCKVLQSFARISHGSESSVFVERRRQNYRMSVASLTSRFGNVANILRRFANVLRPILMEHCRDSKLHFFN